MDDFQLLDQVREGNPKAFKTLFDVHYRPLCSYLLNYTKDLVISEEIAQITFVSFWNKRNNIAVKTSVKSYLYKMAYNEFLKHVRNYKKYDEVLISLTYKSIHSDFTEADGFMDKKIQELNRAIDALPKKSKEILLLKRDGLKNIEISEKLDISIKTVEAQISSSYKKIKRFFKEANIILFCSLKHLNKPFTR